MCFKLSILKYLMLIIIVVLFEEYNVKWEFMNIMYENVNRNGPDECVN